MMTQFPFATERSEWAGSTASSNTQLPFMALTSDDVFAPTSGGPTLNPGFSFQTHFLLIII